MTSAPSVVVTRNGEVLKTLRLQGMAVIGRGEGCVIRLDDRAISRQHAILRPGADGIEIEKKSEFAGVFVNGKDCERAVLKDGDSVALGPFQLKIVLTEESAAESTASPTPAVPVSAPAAPVVSAAADYAPAEASAAPSDEPASESRIEPEQFLPIEGKAEDAQSAEGALGVEQLPDIGLGQEQPKQEQPIDLGSFEMGEEDAATKITPAGKVMVKLHFKPGTANFEDYDFVGESVSIGRGKACDIVLNDKKCSRKNTIIRKAGLTFVIKDLGSSNGTYVNGAKVTEQELSGDDVIQIGDVEFKFVVNDSEYGKHSFVPVNVEDSQDESAALPEISSFISAVKFEAPVSTPDPSRVSLMNSPVFPGQMGGGQPGGQTGIGGLTGIAGVGAAKNGSLLEKFKALPPARRYLMIVVVGALAWLLLEDDPAPKATRQPQSKPSPTASVAPGMMTFERLSREQQKFVETKHSLAFDYFQNREYDKAIFELEKIFALINDYKDSREIERYSREGKRRLEAIEEEKKRKEDEARLKAKIAEMVDEIRGHMEKKNYDKARELFPSVLMLDPENSEVAAWRKEIEDIDELKRAEEQRRQVRAEILKHGWGIYGEAKSQYKAGKYRQSIQTLGTLGDVVEADKKLAKARDSLIRQAKSAIAARRDPILQEARDLESSGELAKAYQLYRKATEVDPDHKEGFKGMNRLRDILHEKAKIIYTEAVMAESYSDFDVAKKKFTECMGVAPLDDIYFERSQRKLSRYVKKGEGAE